MLNRETCKACFLAVHREKYAKKGLTPKQFGRLSEERFAEFFSEDVCPFVNIEAPSKDDPKARDIFLRLSTLVRPGPAGETVWKTCACAR